VLGSILYFLTLYVVVHTQNALDLPPDKQKQLTKQLCLNRLHTRTTQDKEIYDDDDGRGKKS